MSKITDQLTPEDFGKSFDRALFSEWKTSVNEHEKVFVPVIILWLTGLALLVILGGIVGLVLFFAAMFIALGISLSKQKKRKGLQRELGIGNSDLQKAISNCRERIK